MQEEIDQRTGEDRLVDFDDRDFLPYFECVMKEVLRWVIVTGCFLFALTYDRRFLSPELSDGDALSRLVSVPIIISDADQF